MNKLKGFDYKSALPHIIAIFIFIAISSLYFLPQLSGYRLHQGDSITSIGMRKECNDFRDKFEDEPLWTNSMFSGMPAYQISLRNSNFISKAENIILKIMPRPIGYLFLLMIGFYIFLLCMRVDPKIAIIGAIAFGLSSYNILYLSAGHNSKIHAISFIPPLIGSIMYGYRKNYLTGSALLAIFTCLHITANHLQMTYYMLYLIAAIALVQLIIHLQNHTFPRFIKASTFLMLGGILGILPPVANILLTKEYSEYTTRGKSELTITAGENTDSGKDNAELDADYIKQYSLGFGEVWSLVIPNVKGGKMGYLGEEKELIQEVDPGLRKNIAQYPKYWGEQYGTGGAFYFGASVFFLFLLGIFFVKDKMKWAFIGISLLAIVLSWKYGRVTDFFIENIPMFKKFRDTKMMLVLVQISFPLLGALFLKYLVNNKIDRKKYIYVSLGSIGLLFVFYLLPTLWFDFFNRAEIQYFNDLSRNYSNNPNYLAQISEMQNSISDIRVSIFKRDCMRSIFFILITSTVLYLFIIDKLKRTQLYLILGFIVLIDLWAVNKRYLNNEKKGPRYLQWVNSYEYMNPFSAAPADLAILKLETRQNPKLQQNIADELSNLSKPRGLKSKEFKNEQNKIRFRELNFATNYRVFTLKNPFNESQTSYFHKSIGGYHGAKLKKYQELIEFQISNEYASISEAINNNPTPESIEILLRERLPVLNMLNTKYIVYNADSRPIVNPYHYGNAWFVTDLKLVKDADEELLSLNSISNTSAVTQEKFSDFVPEHLIYDSTASIKLNTYNPKLLTYTSRSQTEQLAVFSEIFYDAGWNAYIDGEKTEHFKANYLLRALSIPAGEHLIEFKFEPKTYKLGRSISSLGSVLILLYIIGILLYEVKFRKRLQTSGTEE